MAGALKKTTGLTGLAVARDPHKTLCVVYEKILSVLQKMPESAVYRRNTQLLIQDRLQAVKSEPNIEKLETKINSGQIEEVILQAERELQLARRMIEFRAWEPLVKEAPANQWKWPI
jgi:NADH dehydrogenase (ubiquinone) 1 alpha subcomplex subunit 5